MAITAKELAKELGVSPAAVSIALNGRTGISEKKRQIILEAAESAGLRRDSRKTPVSPVIHLVIFKKHGMVYGDTPFFSALLEGVSAQVSESGCRLQVSYFYAAQDDKEQLRGITSSDCAGILLLATEMEYEDLCCFMALKLPVVILDSFFENAPFDSVVINNVQGAVQAVEYLLTCGHRHLGHIRSSVEISNFYERHIGCLKGVKDCVEGGRCTLDTIFTGSTHETAYRDMNRYLEENPVLPTAFFADNDIIAGGCMRALREHGYNIPEDVSIVGFDDVPTANVGFPGLTTVNVPKEYLGKFAVQKLLERIRSKEPTPTTKTCVNTALVIRDTVKRL